MSAPTTGDWKDEAFKEPEDFEPGAYLGTLHHYVRKALSITSFAFHFFRVLEF
jgi:hypothetical protein